MSNTYQIQYYGTELSAKSFQIPIGEDLTFTVQIYNTDGTARDCTGGTVSFHFTRPNGPHITLPVDGEVSGVHTITLDSLTTILLDGTYTCDFWLTPATGSREKILLNSKLTLVSTVGPNGLYNPSTVIATNIETAKNEAIDTAAADATTKANTARDYAIGVADGYANAAIATAALDATNKANNAISIADGYATDAYNSAISYVDGYVDLNRLKVNDTQVTDLTIDPLAVSIVNGNATINLLTYNQKATLANPVSLSADSSTSILAVTISGLGASKSYSTIIGTRMAINSTATPTNCGYIDIIALASVVTDGSGVATCTIDSSNIDVSTKLKTAIAAATGTIAASTGGFTLYATRPSGVACTVSKCTAWVVQIDEVV